MVTAQLASGSGLLCGLYKQRQVAELPDIGENFFFSEKGGKTKRLETKETGEGYWGGGKKAEMLATEVFMMFYCP